MNIDEIIQLSAMKTYYIIYKKYVIKGKKHFFKGMVIEASLDDLAKFLKNVVNGVDRNYLILPKTSKPTYLFTVNEEGGFYLYGRL